MSNIKETIEYLKGTCNTLDDEDFTIEELTLLDDEIFLCDICNWWCEVCEMSETDHAVCTDCE